MHETFKKVLFISPAVRGEFTSGRVFNLVTSDAETLQMLCQNIMGLISSPLRIIVAMFMLYLELGVSSIVALGVLLLLMPTQVIYLDCLQHGVGGQDRLVLGVWLMPYYCPTSRLLLFELLSSSAVGTYPRVCPCMMVRWCSPTCQLLYSAREQVSWKEFTLRRRGVRSCQPASLQLRSMQLLMQAKRHSLALCRHGSCATRCVCKRRRCCSLMSAASWRASYSMALMWLSATPGR